MYALQDPKVPSVYEGLQGHSRLHFRTVTSRPFGVKEEDVEGPITSVRE